MRKANEDACLAGRAISKGSSEEVTPFTLADEPWIVAVSDGIGGHRAGAEASHEVVQALAQCETVTPAGIADALSKVSRHLCDRGRHDPERAGMGATIAGLAAGPDGLFAFNVGDSRVYKYSRRRLISVTTDDSEAEELIRAGFMSRADVRPGYLHGLTQAIGGRIVPIAIETHIYPLALTRRTRFLVCSDGLTDMLLNAPMRDAVGEKNLTTSVRRLFDLAMTAGGLDNITHAVVDVAPRSVARQILRRLSD
jgi:protein phosphatase